MTEDSMQLAMQQIALGLLVLSGSTTTTPPIPLVDTQNSSVSAQESSITDQVWDTWCALHDNKRLIVSYTTLLSPSRSLFVWIVFIFDCFSS